MTLTWLPDVLRAAGLDVYEMPGCSTRGRSSITVQGVVGHHTATGPRWADGHVAALLRDGRRDLAGPLSQLGLERDGTFVVVACGRANHNGYGKWHNDAIGIEAYNSGVGEPWPPAQVDAYCRGVAAILRHLGLDASHFLGHRETDPRRKIDPAGLDMAAMRRRVSDLLEDDDMPLSDTDLGKIQSLIDEKVDAEGHETRKWIREELKRQLASLKAPTS